MKILMDGKMAEVSTVTHVTHVYQVSSRLRSSRPTESQNAAWNDQDWPAQMTEKVARNPKIVAD